MNNKGVSTLMIVVVIMASTLLIAVSASNLAFGDFDNSLDYHYTKRALYIAEGCFEKVLRDIQINNSYIFDGQSLLYEDGLCIIKVEGDQNSKSVNIESIFNGYHKNISANISVVNNSVNLENYNLY